MPEVKWDIKRGAQIYTAVSDPRVKNWILNGYIKSGEVVVWRSGFSGWRQPEQLEELVPYFRRWEKSQELLRAKIRKKRKIKRKRKRLTKKVSLRKKVKNILIIDDEKDLCELLSDALSRKKYNVAVANTKKEAVVCVKREKPDLAFLDLKLPDGDGMKLLPKIKNISPKTAVSIISAYGSEERREEAKNMGVYSFIDKPFSEEDIFRSIRDYQRGRRKKVI